MFAVAWLAYRTSGAYFYLGIVDEFEVAQAYLPVDAYQIQIGLLFVILVITLSTSGLLLWRLHHNASMAARKQIEQARQIAGGNLAMIVAIEHSLAAATTQEAVYSIMAGGIRQIFPDVTTIFISHYDPKHELVTVVMGLQEGEVLAVAGLPALALAASDGQGLYQQVVRSRQALFVSAEPDDEFKAESVVAMGTAGRAIQSALYLPILAQEDILGFVELQSEQSNRFSVEDADSLALVANTAAVCLQNARLYERAQHEIEERTRVEAALRMNERRFATIFDASPVGIAITRLSDNRIEDVNAAMLSLLGYSREQMIGHSIYDLGIWANPQERQAMLAPLQQAHRITNVETTFNRKSGEQRIVLVSAELIALSSELCILLQVVDITERKLAELALRASEEQYRGLMESLDSMVASLDASGTFLYMNDVTARTLGGPPQAFIGKRIEDIFPDAIAAAYMANLRHVMDEDVALVHEEQVAMQGQLRWHRTSIQPIHDQAGHVSYVLLNSTDIHDLKTAQQALLELNQTLEARVRQRTAEVQDLYDYAPTGFHSLDAEGRFVRVNQTELDWLGYTRNELLGHSFVALIAPESQASFLESFLAFKQHGQVQDLEFDVIRKDGSRLPILFSATALYDETGTYVMSRSTTVDISRRKEAEAALRLANAELARAARTKDEFLANMSHELRTPLNAILAFSESLLETTYGPLSPRQQGAVTHVINSGRHLLALINDILDLSKVEAGRLELQREHVALADVCQASMLFVKEQALKKQLRLTLNLNGLDLVIMADPLRLKQILVNLLANAVKFTPAKGSVILEVRADLEAEIVQFVVEDTGIGIAAADIPRLFKPFSQLDSSLSRQFAGTGLGLALVYRLAEMHGGSCSVASEPGVGSRFTISLPYQPLTPVASLPQTGPTPADTAIAGPALGPHDVRLLLVEDNLIGIQVIGEYLRASGYAVFDAHNGQEALDLAEVAQPDLIVMDIQMPQMDGLEAIRRLRARPTHEATPIIALTALAMPGDRERCLSAGASAYMTKPVSLKRLVETIAEFV
jgi:PAS domain S-box-containing protein